MSASEIHRQAAKLAPVPLPEAAREPWGTFLKAMFWIGLNTFGGPVAQIGFMHQEVVEKRRWVSDGEFVHLLNFANVLPGPEALELTIHLGYLRRGVGGGIAAGLLFIWPGFVSLTTLAWLYERYGSVPVVTGFFDGVRPITVALIAFAVVRLSIKSLKGVMEYAIMIVAFVANLFLGVHFLIILAACGLSGFWLGRIKTPTLAKWQQPLVFLLIATALAAGFVVHGAGVNPIRSRTPLSSVKAHTLGTLPDMGRQVEIAWVNTKAALVTFGGAYTVLPYLREQMVERHRWVTDTQVTDALALGETTPGPLVSFGIFLSYLAGGFLGAAVSCVFLFLPSFLLVLGLGRHIEKVENIPHAQHFLWGVSAATIGLILSMSAQIVPLSLVGTFHVVVAALAFIAFWKFKANAIFAVLIGGVIGLIRSSLA